ncbi:TPD1 protein homolog 1A-like [Solanum verrucosum]|uniref:TPD1 protein homolog 1A-like n=1 Tax=Solanum verrucosum TaxID=315347 RepID=UPI0020D039DB|nr:TPD1 protein homolog 1A-like [Solanum verrucosum]
METIVKFCFTLLLLTLLTKGIWSCGLNNITIGTIRSGVEIKGMPEWNVVVVNNCDCPMQKLVLSCYDFKTTEPVDPTIFKPLGNNACSVNNGNAIKGKDTIKFSYAWDPPFFLRPTSVNATC